MASTDDWFNDFLRRTQAVGGTTSTVTTPSTLTATPAPIPDTSIPAAYAALAKSHETKAGAGTTGRGTRVGPKTEKQLWSRLAEGGGDIVGNLLHQLSRPQNAITQLSLDATDPNKDVSWDSIKRGWYTDKYNSYRTVLNRLTPPSESDLPGLRKVQNFVGGTLADIVLDPLNLIPFGAIGNLATKGAKAGKAATAVAKAGEKVAAADAEISKAAQAGAEAVPRATGEKIDAAIKATNQAVAAPKPKVTLADIAPKVNAKLGVEPKPKVSLADIMRTAGAPEPVVPAVAKPKATLADIVRPSAVEPAPVAPVAPVAKAIEEVAPVVEEAGASNLDILHARATMKDLETKIKELTVKEPGGRALNLEGFSPKIPAPVRTKEDVVDEFLGRAAHETREYTTKNTGHAPSPLKYKGVPKEGAHFQQIGRAAVGENAVIKIADTSPARFVNAGELRHAINEAVTNRNFKEIEDLNLAGAKLQGSKQTIADFTRVVRTAENIPAMPREEAIKRARGGWMIQGRKTGLTDDELKQLAAHKNPEDLLKDIVSKGAKGKETRRNLTSLEDFSNVLGKSHSIEGFDVPDALFNHIADALHLTMEERQQGYGWSSIFDKIAHYQELAKKHVSVKPKAAPAVAEVQKAAESVKTADQIIQEAHAGAPIAEDILPKPSIMEREEAHLSPNDPQKIKHADQSVRVITDVVNQIRESKTYPYVSGTGAKRTHPAPGPGKAQYQESFNAKNQLTGFLSASREATDAWKAKGTKGGAWTAQAKAYRYRVVSSLMKDTEDFMEAKGFFSIIGKGNSGLPMRMSDIFEAIGKEDIIKMLWAGQGKGVSPEGLLNATEHVVRFGRKELTAEQAVEAVAKSLRGVGTGHLVPGLSQEQAIAHANTVLLKTKQITELQAKNSARLGIAVGEAVKPVVNEVLTKFLKFLEHPDSTIADVIYASKGLRREAEVVMRQTQPNAPHIIAEDVAGDMVEDAVKVAQAPTALPEVTRQATRRVDGGQLPPQRAEEVYGSPESPEYWDLAKHVDVSKKRAPILDHMSMFHRAAMAVNPAVGQGVTLRRMFTEGMNQFLSNSNRVQNLLGKTFKAYDTDTLKAGWAALHGRVPSAAGQVDESRTLLSQIVDNIYHTVDADNPVNVLRRNNVSMFHANNSLAEAGIGEDVFRYKTHYTDADGKIVAYAHWADSIKESSPDDVLDFLSRLRNSTDRILGPTVVMQEFVAKFGRRAGAPGTSGWVGIKNVEHYQQHLDGFVFPKELESTLPRYFQQFYENPAVTNHFIRHIVDPVMRVWKGLVTILRPGHHVNNVLGDMQLSFFAGVNNPKHYFKALKMILNTKQYRDLQGVNRLTTGNLDQMLGREAAGGVKIKVKTASGVKFLDESQVYEAAHRAGILPNSDLLEDIIQKTENPYLDRLHPRVREPFGKFGRKVMGGARAFSESRDHFVRLAHFMHELEHSKGVKSTEEAIKRAGAKVRKWHPDGTDLTYFERKYLRRVIPFYSWLRKSTPLMTEVLLTKPGKALIYPKIMYDIAAENNIDPQNLGNPYPINGQIPDWIHSNTIGPQHYDERHHMISEDFKLPITESLDALRSPLNTLFSGLNPFIKVPIELRTGSTLSGTGQIPDKTEYLDRQIPLVSQIGAITGTQPVFGALEALLSGDPEQMRTYNVRRGNVEGTYLQDLALQNWITGQGALDISKPSYIKRAQLEARDKARKEAAKR